MRYRIPLVLIVSCLYLMLVSPVSSQSASVSVSLENNGTCGRTVVFSLSGFSPNSPITVDNNPDRIREYECNGQLKQGAGWRGWNMDINTDGNGNATISVNHGAYGSYEYIFYDGGGRSAAISFEYPSANSQPPPPPPPPPPIGDNVRSGMDLNEYCRAREFESVERTRDGSDAAYSYLCRGYYGGSFSPIDMREVCRFQYGGRLPYVSLGSASDPGSWNCNSQPQPEPSNGYLTYGSGGSQPPPPPPNPTCPTAQTNLALGVIARVNTPQLNVRSDPRSDANRLFQLNQGTLVTIVSGPSCSGGVRWWQIGTSDGRGGWSAEVGSSGSYLLVPNSADNPVQPPPQPPAPPSGSYLEAISTVNVRSLPSIISSRIGQIHPGAYYNIVGKNGNSLWLQINFDGQTVWVCREYVRDSLDVFVVPVTNSTTEDCGGQNTIVPMMCDVHIVSHNYELGGPDWRDWVVGDHVFIFETSIRVEQAAIHVFRLVDDVWQELPHNTLFLVRMDGDATGRRWEFHGSGLSTARDWRLAYTISTRRGSLCP